MEPTTYLAYLYTETGMTNFSCEQLRKVGLCQECSCTGPFITLRAEDLQDKLADMILADYQTEEVDDEIDV